MSGAQESDKVPKAPSAKPDEPAENIPQVPSVKADEPVEKVSEVPSVKPDELAEIPPFKSDKPAKVSPVKPDEHAEEPSRSNAAPGRILPKLYRCVCHGLYDGMRPPYLRNPCTPASLLFPVRPSHAFYEDTNCWINEINEHYEGINNHRSNLENALMADSRFMYRNRSFKFDGILSTLNERYVTEADIEVMLAAQRYKRHLDYVEAIVKKFNTEELVLEEALDRLYHFCDGSPVRGFENARRLEDFRRSRGCWAVEKDIVTALGLSEEAGYRTWAVQADIQRHRVNIKALKTRLKAVNLETKYLHAKLNQVLGISGPQDEDNLKIAVDIPPELPEVD